MVFNPFWADTFTGWKTWSSFSFVHTDIQFSQQHLLKRLFFLHRMFLVPLSKIMWPSFLDSYLGLLVYSTDLHICSCASIMLFLLIWLVLYCLKSGIMILPVLPWLFMSFFASKWNLRLIFQSQWWMLLEMKETWMSQRDDSNNSTGFIVQAGALLRGAQQES
jgi:hypothetical protein